MKRLLVWLMAGAVAGLGAGLWVAATETFVGSRPRAGLNLKQRVAESEAWFGGAAVYEALPTAVYPPGTMALFWPLAAMGEQAAGVAYLLCSVALLIGIGWAFANTAHPDWGIEWVALLAAAPMAVIALSEGVAVGQLHLAVVPAVGAVLLVQRRDLLSDLFAGALFALALVKPSLVAVFGWPLLFASRGRALGVATVLYVGATGVALAARPEPASRLMAQWWFRATEGARFGAEASGYGSVHDLVAALHMPRGSVVATLLVVLAAGAWAWRERHGDIWVLLGVLGLCARFATYHRSYDDVLVLPAVLAGLRLGIAGTRWPAVAALLAWGALVTPAPPAVRVATWLLLCGSLLATGVAPRTAGAAD